MAGNQLESQSKLMFYPTDVFEIYRMLGIIGRLSIADEHRQNLKQYLGEDKYREIITQKSYSARMMNPKMQRIITHYEREIDVLKQ